MRNRNNLSAVQNIFTKSHLLSFKFTIILFASFSTIGIAQIPIPLGTLQPGDTLYIIYDAKINNNIASEMVSVQGKVTANGPITVLSDDPDTGLANDATKTSVCLPLDFGDAPDPVVVTTGEYPTLLANDGARHVVIGGSPILGASIDSEADGQPEATGDGDDLNGDDEDGVVFTSSIVLGTMANVDVTASAAGLLDAWVDFNQNGDWLDVGEQIFTSQALSAGVNSLSFNVPVGALEGNTFTRFRLSTAGGLSPTGLAPDGEVEDYQVNIIANSFTIDDPMVSENGTNLIFTISRTTTTSEDSIDFSIVGGTAVAGSDYTDVTTAMDSTIAFPSTGNVISKTIAIPITSDMIVELDETILAMLSNPIGGGISDGSGTGTIKDNDTAMILIDSLIIPEGALGDTAMMIFTATLDKVVDFDVQVDFTTSDVSAQDQNGDYDYLNNSGAITFLANGSTNQTKTMTVKIIGDGKVEPNETFDLILSNINAMGRSVEFCVPMAVTLKGLGGINNDDAAVLTLATVDASKNEGTGGTTIPFTFSVTLDSAVQGGFSLAYSTNDGTATLADNDYTDNDASLNFAGTASESQMITVLVNHDGKVEAHELFNVALGAISGLAAGIDPGDLSATGSPQNGTITNDDTATFTINDMTVDESSGTMTLTISLDNQIDIPVEVKVNFADVSAVAGSDYTSTQLTASFSANDNSNKIVIVPITNDMIVELSETFTVTLSTTTVVGTRTLDLTDTSTGTIDDNDIATFTIDDQTVDEAGGTMTLTVSLDKEIDVAVDVLIDFTEVTAASGSDFTATQLTASFATNDNADKTVIVPIIEDMQVEPSETFITTLSSSTFVGTRTLNFTDTGNGTIDDNDNAIVTLTGTISQLEGNSGTTDYIFTATLDKAVKDGFDLAYTTDDGTAIIADNDYIDNDGTLNFAGSIGEMQAFTVMSNGDLNIEDDEDFTVSLGSFAMTTLASSLSTSGSPQTGTILDDDCDLPDIPTLNTPAPICMGSSTDIMVLAGNLDDAIHWALYSGSCGGVLVGTSASGTFTVSPPVTTTYFVRGEGGCVPTGTGACAQVTITVEDITPPVAHCQDLTVYLDKNGNFSLTADMVDNGSIDNCGITSMSLDKMTFTCADLGPNLVILTVGDLVGNTDTCHATVTVKDIQINTIPNIMGMSPVCPGLSNVPYSIEPDPNVVSYKWSYSGNGTTIVGDGGPSITINFAPNASSGTLTVEYVTACGPSGIKDNYPVFKASAFICDLAMACPDNLLVINAMIGFPGGVNFFKAGINVFSAATIETDQTVLFRAGQVINLLPNFEVELGALFTAEIQGCGEALQTLENKKDE